MACKLSWTHWWEHMWLVYGCGVQISMPEVGWSRSRMAPLRKRAASMHINWHLRARLSKQRVKKLLGWWLNLISGHNVVICEKLSTFLAWNNHSLYPLTPNCHLEAWNCFIDVYCTMFCVIMCHCCGFILIQKWCFPPSHSVAVAIFRHCPYWEIWEKDEALAAFGRSGWRPVWCYGRHGCWFQVDFIQEERPSSDDLYWDIDSANCKSPIPPDQIRGWQLMSFLTFWLQKLESSITPQKAPR